MSLRAGRDCPLDYGLPTQAFGGPACMQAEVLYVVGGLYGNRQALGALQQRLRAEPTARVVFNGDAHWFDRDPQVFNAIEQGLAGHLALRGNVETELGRDAASGAGCGCAYPASVADSVVQRSNAIQALLKQTVEGIPCMAVTLSTRGTTAVVDVAGRRVAISHGDEQSLAGWNCSREALADEARAEQLDQWFLDHQVDVLATSHTCSAVAINLKHGALINNGASGLPNFNNGCYGVISRIATHAHPAALYRAERDGLFIEALALNYDHAGFLAEFDRQWSHASPAALSYRARILGATDDTAQSALLAGFSLCQTLCALEALES